jgi:Lrp/AsnC family leucine-responsive transcriptional regulator
MRRSKLDEIDLQLLKLLQEDGRMPQCDLADAVGLSSPATGERLRKLLERGIVRFTAVLDPKQLEKDITAFIAVGIDGSKHYEGFVRKAIEHPEVLECHAITGEGSHILKVRTGNTLDLERLLATVQAWPGVHRTTTSIVLSTRKETANQLLDPSHNTGGE